MPVPPIIPAIEAPPIGDITALRNMAPPAPRRLKPKPQMTSGRYPSEYPIGVTLPPPAGGGLTYSPTRTAMSEAYRKTKSPAPIRTRPITINPILRRAVRGRLDLSLAVDTEPGPPIPWRDVPRGNKDSIWNSGRT